METNIATDQLLYLYAFIPTDEQDDTPDMPGIDPDTQVEYVSHGDITSVVCRVKKDEFNEDQLKKNVENMKWLQDKAFHHHEMMNRLHQTFTIIPLKFGTIYETMESLESIVNTHRERIVELFSELSDKEEWNVKVYADKEKFTRSVLENSPEIERKKQEIESLSKGKQFFERRKLDQFVEKQAEKEVDEECGLLHEKLKEISSKAEVKKNWNQKVTGRTEEMCWNSAYLIDRSDMDRLTGIMEEAKKEADEKESGLDFAVTGPWPAYHFSSFTEAGE
ncbi:GvpL/GvpF family gas vesicle protein [Alteribacter keqinensis]|uniref:Gas vesicle protein GvpL n=1 Tax=Alteribacter keqinensis TaxID=2483800 RepID=A0A3M7TRE6_9BACI|nr:GvpL/GvpF family gas vesicle protein [Alteribacter keqinensis]RNA67759.1 gas vesicle protein GvpL [Alteribacter keqinensis]